MFQQPMIQRFLALALALGSSMACAQRPGSSSVAQQARGDAIDSTQLMHDLRVLAADSMEGRRAGSAGGERARRYLLESYRAIGLQPFGSDFAHPFALGSAAEPGARGINLVGYIPGSARPGRFIVVTAHYDHVGIRNGEIYNGADDNASGVAGMLALARHFRTYPPAHSIIFAALDAEEMGLQGARAFVQNPPVSRDSIALNVNLDMVGRNQRGELYAAGTYHYPLLRPLLERVAASAPVTLRLGHDSPELGSNDWTQQSDHGAFHAAGIPFVYFGVEDHPDYHRPTDDAERIEPDFFVRAVRTVLLALKELDAHLAEVERARREG